MPRCQFVLVAFVLIAVGCSLTTQPIMVILPDGYVGEFRIVKDSANGQKLVQQNGWWVFEIPDDGTLYVHEDWPFYLWHSFSVRYRDGRPAAIEDLGTRAGSRSTGPNSIEFNGNFDGTTQHWRVLD
jgi:hypothetical protein